MTSLRDSHARVFAISKFCPYEYKQALFCMIAGAVLCILRGAMAVVVLDISYS